jgi:predicted RNA-binding Zn-ribbon protein involved in translation (DUF1610 family)
MYTNESHPFGWIFPTKKGIEFQEHDRPEVDRSSSWTLPPKSRFGVKYRSPKVTQTFEYQCPMCTGTYHERSWDPERGVMTYHCSSCGIDSSLTWAEVVVLRTTGKITYDEHGELVIPDDVTVGEPPEDPDSILLEKPDQSSES